MSERGALCLRRDASPAAGMALKGKRSRTGETEPCILHVCVCVCTHAYISNKDLNSALCLYSAMDISMCLYAYAEDC